MSPSFDADAVDGVRGVQAGPGVSASTPAPAPARISRVCDATWRTHQAAMRCDAMMSGQFGCPSSSSSSLSLGARAGAVVSRKRPVY
jgi:hypothetical protein